MPVGKIVHFCERGFGFIQPDTGPPNVFVHISQIENQAVPEHGERVAYDLSAATVGRRPRTSA
jgi:CspA family cold shock protein